MYQPVFLIDLKLEQSPEQTIRIHCPSCECKDTRARCRQQSHQLRLFFVLPLFRKSTTRITCNRCGAQLTCRLACETLHNTTPSDIQLYPTTHWTWWMVVGILLTTLTLSVSW